MTGSGRTVQLRRYHLEPGESDAFVAWWREVLVPIRVACGFRIEFGYLLAGTDEFLWAVSVAGTREAFERVEAAYVDSPERAGVFANLKERVRTRTVNFADDVLDAPHDGVR